MARRLGLKEIYEIIVDQGVRAELLLTRLDQYEVLLDEDDERGNEGDQTLAAAAEYVNAMEVVTSAADEMNAAVVDAAETFTVSSNVLSSNDSLIKSVWTRTADLLLPKSDLRLLTVEPTADLLSALQSRHPSQHHIIASDPTILGDIESAGWSNRENDGVIVHREDWAALLPRLLDEGRFGTGFDAIYFGNARQTTKYKQLRAFFSEWAEQLLNSEGGVDGQGGLLNFFHGIGAERQVMYDVYTKILEMDLFEANFDTEWEDIPVPGFSQSGSDVATSAADWSVETYRLPICRLVD